MNIQTVTFKETSFIHVTNPGKLEIKYLKNNFGFDILHLDDFINKIQTPKIEIYKNYSMIVLGFPFFSVPSAGGKGKTGRLGFTDILSIPKTTLAYALPQFPPGEKLPRIISSQVDFFIGKDYLVVLHEGNPLIDNIFSLCQGTLKNRDDYMGQGPVFLAYRIIDVLIDSCFPILNELSATIDKIDRELENPKSEHILEMISVTRRNIVVFHTMIKPIVPLFKQLGDGKYKELNGQLQPFWSNVLDHLQKIWDRLEDNRELLEGISASHESFLTSKTNEIVKVLTIFSAIILPLTLFASIYGMNIKGLPASNHDYSFIVLFSFIIFIGALMLYIFKLKRWF